MSQKGSKFERDFCTRLSLWWGGEDDYFWRTSGSGGRAKRRGRAGKGTTGQHGDICATRPEAEPFIKLITTELKRGYNSQTLIDVVDKPKTAARQTWEVWVEQARESADHACSYAWMIVHKRDRHEAIVAFPHCLFQELTSHGSSLAQTRPLFTIRLRVKDSAGHKTKMDVVGTTLDKFLRHVTPDHVRTVLKFL